MMQNIVKIQKIFDIESINPDVFNTLNTMFENNAIEYDVETNTLTVNVDIVLKFKENIHFFRESIYLHFCIYSKNLIYRNFNIRN